ncbi:uncharacterized protein LOC112049125 [Bicyclus anynana]|uniref:Uncharacterized protein LOC112049125 n=1 Tax=Bicyclus anynana TaxID=110368 RepID=A0ABM3M4N0_BICAN|nr:uncharacterized protein LOC112049125 [Bicyclus anynana]
MQFNQADAGSSNRVGVDENLIKFKPSPNFKNMKKFIKSRSTTTVDTILPVLAANRHAQAPANMDRPHMLLRPDWHNPEVQPPLPLDPPPPDEIPNIRVKQEIVDTDYETAQAPPRLEHTDQADPEPPQEAPSKVCRDYIRGTCKRESTCKYAHKYDLSQLEGVYTFCRKFQNSVCTFNNCKYVHATVFEEQNFYRTGILPAHALHHKTNNVLQPPPPPPPPEDQFSRYNIDFSNPPPPLPNNLEQPMISCIPTTCAMEARLPYIAEEPAPATAQASRKRHWNAMDPLGAPPCDIVHNEQLTKKCKHCDIMEFRLEHNKNKVKKMLQSKEQLAKKTSLLEKKTDKLRSLISEMLKPPVTPKTTSHSANVVGDKDKTLLESLNAFLSVNGRLSTMGENK